MVLYLRHCFFNIIAFLFVKNLFEENNSENMVKIKINLSVEFFIITLHNSYKELRKINDKYQILLNFK
jgi:hypothetical protein